MPSVQDEQGKCGAAMTEQELVLNLQRTNDQIQIHFTRLFRHYGGLTSSQYNILRILRAEGRALKSLDIADRTITVVPGITGLLDRLEEAGLVRRERSVDDRRKIFVSLTDQGQDLLAQLDQPVLELHRQILGNLSAAEQQELQRLLDRLREGLPAANK